MGQNRLLQHTFPTDDADLNVVDLDAVDDGPEIVAQAAAQPVISIDKKKTKLIGNVKDGGSGYRPKAIRIVP